MGITMRCTFFGVIGPIALLASGCTGAANIAIPPSLAAKTERLQLTGLGGTERGAFRLATSEGRFTRQARQDVYVGGLNRNYGSATFEANGPDFGTQLAGKCGFEEEEQEFGAATIATLRFAYRCTFSRAGVSAGGLIIEEVPMSPGKLLSGRTRAGEAHLEGQTVQIRPLHRIDGSRLTTGTPVGYAFAVAGEEVGALDLNGLDKTIYAPPAGKLRNAVVAASLALSVLRDPIHLP